MHDIILTVDCPKDKVQVPMQMKGLQRCCNDCKYLSRYLALSWNSIKCFAFFFNVLLYSILLKTTVTKNSDITFCIQLRKLDVLTEKKGNSTTQWCNLELKLKFMK